MRPLLVLATTLAIALTSTAVEAKGCIKGAIIGGSAGHFAGHGKIGAVAGCVIGHHEATKADASRSNNATDQKTARTKDDGRI